MTKSIDASRTSALVAEFDKAYDRGIVSVDPFQLQETVDTMTALQREN